MNDELCVILAIIFSFALGVFCTLDHLHITKAKSQTTYYRSEMECVVDLVKPCESINVRMWVEK